MTPEEWQRVRPILESALELDSANRPAFLDGACADPSLRREVESLLAVHEQAGTAFLNPAAAPGFVSPDEARFRLPSGKRIGPYEILEEIAQGGMGAVYRAVRADGQYKQQVALKIVRADLSADLTAERLRNERQILASLDHPNIAKILDGGTADGLPYFVMELIDGLPVNDYCDNLALSIDARLKLFRTVCSAVHYAHQHLVIHRDLKPDNILITAEGVPKLLDFGIAKILDPVLLPENVTMTAAGLWMMTPEYASPEQLRGEPITTATDVYSLGLVLYELLTGHRAYRFAGRMPHAVAQAVLETDPEKPSAAIRRIEEVGEHEQKKTEITPEVVSGLRSDSPEKLRHHLSGDLDNIVLKTIRKEPRERYNSADQLSEDIRRHLEGLPVLARKNTIAYRCRKYIFRHKVGVAAVALVFLSLLTGIVLTVREARIARANELRAEQRFNDVRKLANSLMFEVHDSIQDLPGATAARKLIIERAQQYLDSLSQEAARDPGLQRELAAAYQRLGDVQGEPRGASLGDSEAALQSHMKALRLREMIASAIGASSEDQLQLGKMHDVVAQIFHFSGDLDQAEQHAKKAVSLARSVSSGHGVDHSRTALELARAYRVLGEIEWSGMAFGSLAEPSAALDYYRKGLAVLSAEEESQPNGTALVRAQEVLRMQIARTLSQIGRRSEAIQELGAVLAYFRDSARPSSVRSRRDLASALEMLGHALERDGRFRESFACYREELTIIRRLSELDSASLQFRFDLAGADFDVGASLMRQGKLSDGLRLIQRAISMEEPLIHLDQKRPEYRTWLAVFRVAEGETLARLHRNREALASFEAARALYDSVVHSDQQDVDERLSGSATDVKIAATLLRLRRADEAKDSYRRAAEASELATSSEHPRQQAQYTLADAYSGLGDVASYIATRTTPAAQRTSSWREASSWYEKSLRLWHTIPNPSIISPNGFDSGDPQTVARKLRRSQAAAAVAERQLRRTGEMPSKCSPS